MNYFVTAIGTGCGKTLASAIICEKTGFDYWKPIQSGTEDIDSVSVKNLISNPKTSIYPEKYILKTPVSPHQSAEIDGIKIDLKDIIKPKNAENLIIEGAGGVLVPLNYSGDFVIDIATKMNAEVVLVSSLYLGSINHTLLTFNELKNRNIKIKGIIFNGVSNKASERIISEYTQLECLLHINQEENISKEIIKKYAKVLKW